MDVATYHNIDQVSGMIETSGNYVEAFTAERKQQFIDVYVSSGLRFIHTCKQLGLSHHTINHHFEIDPVFSQQIKDAQDEYAENLEAKQRNYALDQKCFMDRAMQLRALLPEKYAKEQNTAQREQTIINVQGDLLIDAKKRIESLTQQVDQNIIDTTANIQNTVQPTHNNASIPADTHNMLDINTIQDEKI